MLGAVLTGCVGLGVAWVLGALALANGGDARREVQRSAILQRAQRGRCRRPGGLLDALARLDPFPRIDGPEARVPAPTAGDRPRPRGVRAAAGSVVKILGTACGLGVEGSGWVAGDGLVVTNAHVVAGPEGHAGAAARAPGPGAGRARASPSTRATTSPCCACRAERAARCRWPPTRGRAPRRRSSASRATARTTCAPGRLGADARGDHPGRLRARARCGARSPRCAARCAPATPAARWSTATGASWPRSSRRPRRGPRGGFGVPNAIVRARSATARASSAGRRPVPAPG